MNLRRFLHPDAVRLKLRTKAVADGEAPSDFDPASPRNVTRVRENVCEELVELFELSGSVAKPKRLHREFVHREKKASSAVGNGIALPHLRTLQVKSFVMVFARSPQGLPFDAPDEEPVHLFFGMAAPPYDDRTYLRVYKTLAKVLLDQVNLDVFLHASEPSEVLRALEVVF